ncbi:MAG: hormogonium polysaccharide biosynthesis glycosyltransferase HpsP [Cyanobacteria bacterium P01_D01_bin.128]
MAPPLNVLQIVPSIALVYGGPSQMVRGLSAGLANAGAAVTVLTTDSNGDIDQPPLQVPLNQPVPTDGYQIRYFRCAPFRRYKFSAGLLNWLWAHGADYDIAHIHALFSPVSSLAAAIARRRRLPYILRPLGTLDPADLQKKRQLKQIYAAVLERPNIAGAAALHFTSAQEAKISERFGATTRDLVLPLGVSPTAQRSQIEPYQRFNLPRDRPLLLYMSRIDPKKGIELLIPALETLIAEDVPFHLVLCGANPQDRAYETRIREQIAASPLGDRATLTGFVSGDLKAALLAAADVFVLPSYYENFGIAVAEAMMAGKPVVISNGIHIWEGVSSSESGWVIPTEVGPLTDALREALSQPAERQRRGGNAKHYAETHYSWDAIAQKRVHNLQRDLSA